MKEEYFTIIIESLKYCRGQKGMEIYGWCVMSSHIHLIMRANQANPETFLGKFKEYTSKNIQKAIKENQQGSRREWMMWVFERAGKKSSNVQGGQFWLHHNKPIELWTPEVTEQKLEYLHHNPVKAGFVLEPEHWKYSSAIDYSGGKGLLEMDFL